MKTKKATAENVIMAAIFVIVSIVLFWKCRYGYMDIDEAFYPTFAYRFLQGDSLIYDEWSGFQLSGIVIMPFIKLYMLMNGSTDGIYLFIRYTYSVLKILIAALIYFRLKKYSKISAYVSMMVFYIYSRSCVTTLSYNTISFGGVLVALLLWMNDADSVKTRIYWVLSGVALAVSVFGIPYNVIIYFAYAIAVVVLEIYYRKAEKSGKHINRIIRVSYSYRALEFVTVGVAVCAVIFFIYLFYKITPSQLIESIPNILSANTEHPTKSLWELTGKFAIMMVWGTTRAVSGIVALIIVVYLCDRNRQKRYVKYVAVAGVTGVLLILSYLFKFENPYSAVTIAYSIYTPNVLAVLLIIIVRDESVKEMFAGIVAPGLLSMYTLYMASAAGFYTTTSASCVAAVGSVMVIMLVLKKYLTADKGHDVWEKTAGAVLALFVFMEIVLITIIRFTLTGYSEAITTMNVTINDGVAKGIICNQEQYDRYMAIYEDTEAIRNMPEDTKVIYKGDTMLWMSGSQRCASYTTFYSSTKVYAETLQKYYTVHPDKVADVIYVYGKDSSYEEELVNKLIDMYSYSVKRVNTGWILSK